MIDKHIWDFIHAFEQGIDDGFLTGHRANPYMGSNDAVRQAYERGYDHGVWLYSESVECPTDETRFYGPRG